MSNFYKIINSPIGDITLVADQKNLLAVSWQQNGLVKTAISLGEKAAKHPVLQSAEKQLTEFFSGKRKKFDLPTKFVCGTEFQKKVWRALTKIPYGKKINYSDLAAKIAAPKACRAVGAACGKNPLGIVVPCHRVIGKNGSLTGFAGGLKRKSFLLNLEIK